jgi:hypothetical protein
MRMTEDSADVTGHTAEIDTFGVHASQQKPDFKKVPGLLLTRSVSGAAELLQRARIKLAVAVSGQCIHK